MTVKIIGGGAGGQRGSCSPLADKGGGANGIKCPPPPFRRLSGMMPARTGKNIGIYK